MNCFKAAVALLCATSIGQAAASQDAGTWAAISDRSPKGTPVCVLAWAPMSGDTVKNVAIKSFAGAGHLNVTLYKDSWNIPGGTHVPVSLDFADNEPLALDGYGDGKIVDLALPPDATGIFLTLVAQSQQMRFAFPKGREPIWGVALKSVVPKVKAFAGCMKKQENTQPF